MEITEFKKYIETALNNNIISEAEKDDFFYDCAMVQSENGDIQKVINKIIEEIQKRR